MEGRSQGVKPIIQLSVLSSCFARLILGVGD
jgi:hypothetical protein